jgi:hypothetical protein
MFETPQSSVRRNLLHGGSIVVLLCVAIASGYVILSPGTKSAPQAALVGSVIEVRPPVADMMQSAPAHSGAVTPPAPAVATAEAPKPVASPKPTEPMKVAESPRGTEATTARAATQAAVAPVRPPVPAVRPWRSPEPTSDTPWPAPTVTGRVVDDEHKPLAGASIVVRGVEIRTDAEGNFKAERVPPDAALLVKLPGFEKTYVAPTRTQVEVVLKPQVIKAAYLTYFGVGDRGIRGRVLDLAARTEINAVVIDVKGDRGWILYQTEVPQALTIGAQGPGTLKDFDSLMADLKARGIYTIARIVTFKDNILANARPDLAITDTRTGKPWVDNEKLAWVDPFQEEVWAYNIAIGQEAIRRGFDEVQYDYVRFPTDGKLSATKYAKTNSRETRLPTIAAFLAKARTELGASGAFVAADLFGYTAFNENDTDIGQRIEELAPHLDFICPMVYPSGYHKGIPGHPNPVLVPGKVVSESVRLIRKRAGTNVVRVRPWLQDFKDYAFDRRIFGVTEVTAQIRGAEESGAAGWLLWNPRNDYTAAALRSKQTLARP